MKMLACVAASLAALFSCAHTISSAHAETTLCTEITALPFIVTAQGVYCLKNNLNVNLSAANSAAITINTGNVIIDFNDFRVNNQAPLATNQAIGVFAQDRKNITLRNGFIRGFYYGIFLDEVAIDGSENHLVEGMKIADSGNGGIQLEGDNSIVRDNRVLNIGGGPSSSAIGILLQMVTGGIVADNFVSGVTETYTNAGIYIGSSNGIQVSGNEVSRINGGSNSDQAISISSAYQPIIVGNRLFNDPGTGTGAIVAFNGSANVVCRDNEVGGFSAAPFSGCIVNVGNVIDFN